MLQEHSKVSESQFFAKQIKNHSYLVRFYMYCEDYSHALGSIPQIKDREDRNHQMKLYGHKLLQEKPKETLELLNNWERSN